MTVRLRMTARVVSPFMGSLKDRLNEDLRTAMKGRDELTVSTLRMALAAVRNAEVSGTAARDLSDDEVTAVLTKEAKKRREAATAFAGAGRADQAARENAEGELLDRYLPQQLTDDEIARLVADTLAAGGFSRQAQVGPRTKGGPGGGAGRGGGR